MTRASLLCLLAMMSCSCSNGDEPDEEIRVDLDLEIRDSATLSLERRADRLDVRLKPSKGFGIVEDGATLAGKGTLERFPEADVELYTARFSLPPHATGPCAEQPVSVALSLHRRGRATRLSGSLTPYCGRDTWYGTPARGPLRLSTPKADAE